jgi:hypothetical protein
LQSRRVVEFGKKLLKFDLISIIQIALYRIGFPVTRLQLRRVGKIVSRARLPTFEIQPEVRVLYGPTFPTWEPSLLVDRTFASSLREMGARVIPFYCDAVQLGPCSVADDKWTPAGFANACKKCNGGSELLWDGLAPVRFSDFVKKSDALEFLKSSKVMTTREIEEYSQDSLGIGHLARQLTLNGMMAETPSNPEAYRARLEIHFANLRLALVAIRAVLDDVKPNRIVSNDSHYGMWAIMEHEAKNRGIPFYAEYPVASSRVSFSSNKPAASADIKDVFSVFKHQELSERDEAQLNNWVGANGMLQYRDNSELKKIPDFSIGGITGSALLLTNAVWDLASLDRQVVFPNMLKWLEETLRWFADHPQYGLFVRNHPIESNPLLPVGPQRVADFISQTFDHLPGNIRVLPPDTDSVRLRTLVKAISPSITVVHTSTAALECALEGVPVVTTGTSPFRGLGFTLDPSTPEEYFRQLEKSLTKPDRLKDDQLDLVRKFVSYYQFRYQTNAGIYSGNPPRISKNLPAFLTDEKSGLRHALGTVLRGDTFHSKTNWSPNI